MACFLQKIRRACQKIRAIKVKKPITIEVKDRKGILIFSKQTRKHGDLKNLPIVANEHFSETSFCDCDFRDIEFELTEFYDNDFSGASFSNVGFNLCIFDNAKFDNVRMDSVEFRGVIGLDGLFRNCEFENVQFVGTTLDGARFVNEKIVDSSFLPDCYGVKSSIRAVNFSRSIFKNVQFFETEYDKETIFPESFDPEEELGLILVP